MATQPAQPQDSSLNGLTLVQALVSEKIITDEQARELSVEQASTGQTAKEITPAPVIADLIKDFGCKSTLRIYL